MRTQKFSVVLLMLLLVSFVNCSNDESSVTGYEKTDLENEALFKESQDYFNNHIKNIHEPDYESLAYGPCHHDDHNILTPQWNEGEFSESESAYTLNIPLSGNSVQSAALTSQRKVNEKYKLEASVEDIKTNLIFVKNKKTQSIHYQIITTIKGLSKATTFESLIIQSDKHGICSLPFYRHNNQYQQAFLSTDATITQSDPLEFTSIKFAKNINARGITYYIGNRNNAILKSESYIYNCAMHGWTIGPKTSCAICDREGTQYYNCAMHGIAPGSRSSCSMCDASEYCNKHPLNLKNSCPICKPSSGQNYKCGSCGLFLGTDKDNCSNCGSNPNKKPAVPCDFCSGSGSGSGTTNPEPDYQKLLGEELEALERWCDETSSPDYVRSNVYCDVFYLCTKHNGGGILAKFTCTWGLVFDPANRFCNWPQLVEC